MQLLRRLSRSGSRKSSAADSGDTAASSAGSGSADGEITASSATVTERDLADQARISSDWLSSLSQESSAGPPKGILKNSGDTSLFHADELEAASAMSLEESLKVAQANALANQGRASKTGELVLDTAEDAMDDGDDSPTRMRGSEPVGVSDKKVADADGDISMGTAVEWDEANLEQNETERVPRMKIDEPKTPFHERPTELDDPSLDPIALPSAAVASAMSHASEEEEVVNLDDQSSAELVYKSGESSERIERRSSFEEASAGVAAESTLASKDGALMADSDYQSHLTKMAVERRDAEARAEAEEAGLTDEERRALEKKRKFAAKRKAHYDEFHAVKAIKKKKLEIKSTWEED